MNIKALSLCCLLGIEMVVPSMGAMQANASRWSSAKKWAAIGAGAAGIGGVIWWLWRGRGPTPTVPGAGLAMAQASMDKPRSLAGASAGPYLDGHDVMAQAGMGEPRPLTQQDQDKVLCTDLKKRLDELEIQESPDKFVDNVKVAWINPVSGTGNYRLTMFVEVNTPSTGDCADANRANIVCVEYMYYNLLTKPESSTLAPEFNRETFWVINQYMYTGFVYHGHLPPDTRKFVAPGGMTIRINIDPRAVAAYVARTDVTDEETACRYPNDPRHSNGWVIRG